MSSRLHHSVASSQLPVASGEAAHSSISASRGLRVPASSPHGFTLVEMLVVMGIIVLALLMAIPTIRYLTGSKSQQGAENTMAAMLARTRSDAIGLQQPQGVLFLFDQASGRVELVEVMQTVTASDPPGVVYLDLVPDRDPLFLPPGIGAWTIKDTYTPPAGAYTDPFLNYRYLGYNNDTINAPMPYTGTVPTDRALIGGVILFDGQGNLLVTPYGFRFLNTISTPATPTSMAGALITIPPSSLPPSLPALWPASAGAAYLRSQLGFVLFDKETFENQERLLSPTPAYFEGNPSTAANSSAEPAIDSWLDVNTTPLLVNRYNGTLSRAE